MWLTRHTIIFMSASTHSLSWPANATANSQGNVLGQHINHYGLSQLPSCRDALIEHFQRTRQYSMDFSEPLTPEDQMLQGMADTSPNKWHLAHTTWFFETFILKPQVVDYQSPDDRYGFLFNSYYNRVGKQHMRSKRGLLSRPSLEQVVAYRSYVDAAMVQWLQNASDEALAECAFLVALGINHEEQHQELMVTDLKYSLSFNLMAPAIARSLPAQQDPGALRFVTFDGGKAELGHNGETFAFDNEQPRHTIWLQDYQLAERPITNGEFLEFIEDGGYSESLLWVADGWFWRQSKKIHAPLYWAQEDGQWFRHTLAGRVALDPHATLSHVSWFEASAFAQWRQARLATEAEWEHAAQHSDNDFYSSNGFSNNKYYEPQGCGAIDHSQAPQLRQMAGHVWEWTSSAYSAYPGFKPFAGNAGEYNGKFMANQFILRGGSCATPPGHARATYRNFFYPPDRWQYSGIRLAKDAV